MRYALVHDWLVNYAGAERVLERLVELLPQADLFSLIDALPPGERRFIGDKPVHTSFLQRVPFAKSKHRLFFPLMPMAIEQLDLSDYDIVVSSSHAFAKGVITRGDQFHISYVHTPVRYAWELQHEYLRQSGYHKGLKSAIVRLLLHYVRQWDVGTANRVDLFVCNSKYIANRIWRTYRRTAQVVYPPVDVDAYQVESQKEDFYLAASRFVPYKHMKTIVEAFAKLRDRRLIVIGDGPEFRSVTRNAAPNVKFLGFQPFPLLHEHMRNARAFIFAADEDFGIMPVEAQACGTPIIAFGKGGATETVVPGKTGLFFKEQTAAAIAEAVRQFEDCEDQFDAGEIRENSERFRPEVFLKSMASIVDFAIDSLNDSRRSLSADWRDRQPDLRFDGRQQYSPRSVSSASR
jgi:glycosyltransferase involved in cell wall biosynthesis